MISLFLSFALLQQAESIQSDPTFKELSKLVGGNWVGHVNADTEIRQHFEFAVDRKLIRGNGSVLVKGKVVLYTQANMGWDPSVKKVFYVDFHNHDTVYMGHVTLKDGWMEYDFSEFADSTKHYDARSKFTDKNHYQFLLGKETITMERKR